MAYYELVLEQFKEDISRYPNLARQINKKKLLILEKPYHYSTGLGQGKWRNLKGLRSVHMQRGRYVFLIAICEDCIKNGHIRMNQQYCGDNCLQEALARVVFIAFGQHDATYGKL